ncbi:hypothetical protein GCM10022393_01790 [Aquimarina addita]|uniref:DUF6268 domain-containing protein n=1 Tax=Aquimarina addita TaxID=870485 RepID=A0ABP7X865_9FLAO
MTKIPIFLLQSIRYYGIVCLLSIVTFQIDAQVSDLARIEYTYFPQRDSDNSFKRLRTFINVPIKIGDKGTFLVPGIEYRGVYFDYEDAASFDVEGLENFRSLEVSIGYTFKMKNDWRFAIKTGAMFASNFERDKLISDDYLYSGALYFLKNKTKDTTISKPWRLIVGLQYSTTAGRPFPLPFVNYFKRFHPDWTYTVGVPKSNLKYFFDPKNIVQAFATLDGFYANIQNNRVVEGAGTIDEKIANSISMTIALAGLGYEHYFTKHLVFYSYAGFTILNDIRLRDDKQEDVLTVNDSNSAYIRAGLKFKI